MIVETVHIPYTYGDVYKLIPISDIHYDGNHEDSIIANCGTNMTKRLVEKLNKGD